MRPHRIIGGILFAGLLAVALLAGMSFKPGPSAAEEPAKFASYEELARYIKENTQMAQQFSRLYGRGLMPAGSIGAETKEMLRMDSSAAQITGQAEKSPAPDFSGTNIQVQGVDEADLVKTDGSYLYVISGDKLFILRAHTEGNARQLAEIKLDGQPTEAFINGDTLVVFGNGPEPETMYIRKYDVSDRSKPELLQDNKCDGYYVNSRMIGDYIYVVNNAPVYRAVPSTGATSKMRSVSPGEQEAKITLPRIITDGQARTIPPTEIYCFPYPDHSYRYTTILTLSAQKSYAPVRSKTFLTGMSQHLYMSRDNIYLTGSKAPDFKLYTGKLLDGLAAAVPPDVAEKIKAERNSGRDYGTQLQRVEQILDDYLSRADYDKALALEEKIAAYRDKWHRDMARDQNKTVIYKLAIENDRVEYRTRGEVDGQVLNQFSMDEYDGRFRIATTSRGFWFAGPPNPKNNVYVLDENLEITGKLLGLAPTERIYSARFMGDRAYLVTFREVDPLFVIDLKDPTAPRVLGELKIPGYSNYLHPYDENHLIGIGREVAVLPQPQPDPARPMVMPPPTRQLGVKIALFDVSNPSAPREVAKYVVERDDSESPALHDHRAVLFNKERNLLVLPISYMPQFRIMAIEEPGRKIAPDKQGWQGAYVFDISPRQGIRLRGKVEHPATLATDKHYSLHRYNSVQRSLYIEDVLYTISHRAVKLNDLENLRELKQIDLR